MIATTTFVTAGTATASAATVSISEAGPYIQLNVRDTRGEDNDLTVLYTVERDEDEFVRTLEVTDRTATLTPGKGCSKAKVTRGSRVRCGLSVRDPEPFFEIRTGPGDDRVRSRISGPRRRGPIPIGPIGGDLGPFYFGYPAEFSLGKGNDLFIGSKVDEVIEPGVGDDQVRGGGGSDSILSEEEIDGRDELIGGKDRDLVDYSKRSNPLVGNLVTEIAGEKSEEDSVEEIEGIHAGSAADLLRGDDEGNFLIGGDGRDRIVSGKGHDQLVGGGGADRLEARGGRDFVVGSGGSDSMFGGDGDDFLEASNDRKHDGVHCGRDRDYAYTRNADTTFGCERTRTVKGDVHGPIFVIFRNWREHGELPTP